MPTSLLQGIISEIGILPDDFSKETVEEMNDDQLGETSSNVDSMEHQHSKQDHDPLDPLLNPGIDIADLQQIDTKTIEDVFKGVLPSDNPAGPSPSTGQ